MLEIRNITKIYRSKTGEEVRALDNVSIQFPESGMVFLLGKSGSGKSTLLNVIGGLDAYDSGEFVIMGKSSNEFVGSDFDAYRNTFIGFIFQEYNVLDDFTVGANIGLALELQGQKATNEAINAILSKVDLTGYAHRKPNELSGGQKQRVAIARALVKNPQIIMADEPTGALDSTTGKQIFDVLKELSREKLVLVVSHDRDFAERYADRIIELSDGRVIEDVTKRETGSEKLSEGVHRVSNQILRIESGYRLTAKDLEMINAYLARAEGDVILSGDSRVNEELRAATGITKEGGTAVFEGTDPKTDIKTRTYDKTKTKFIRSRLPMKNAVKMGASGLKHKKFRLVMTILLSFISFAMFGLADTMAAYDQITQATASVLDSHVRNATFTVSVRHTSMYDDEVNHYYHTAMINDSDIAYLKEQTGLNFVPVYNGSSWSGIGSGIRIEQFMEEYQQNTVYNANMTGFVAMGEDDVNAADLTVIGRLPENAGEIAITELMYRQFNQYGFKNDAVSPVESVGKGQLTTKTDGSADSIIGKHLSFRSGHWIGDKNQTFDLEIVGVIDTGFDYTRYADFLPTDGEGTSNNEDGLMDYVLRSELEMELAYGFHSLGFMTEEGITSYMRSAGNQSIGTYMGLFNGSLVLVLKRDDYQVSSLDTVAGSGALDRLGEITWLDGRDTPVLGKNEILLPLWVKDGLGGSELPAVLTDSQFAAIVAACGGERIFALTEPDPENISYTMLQRYRRAQAIQYIEQTLSSDSRIKAYMERAAEQEGFVGSAEEFWIKKWMQDGATDYPYEEIWDETTGERIPVKDFWEFENIPVGPDLIAVLEDMWGMEFEEGITQSVISHFLFSLDRFYEDRREVKLEFWEIRSALSYYYAYLDVTENKLWENPGMIELFLEEYGWRESDWISLDEQSKAKMIIDFYANRYIDYQYSDKVSYYDTLFRPTYCSEDLEAFAKSTLLHMSGKSEEELLQSLVAQLYERSHETGEDTLVEGFAFQIAGFYDGGYNINCVVSDTIHAYYLEQNEKFQEEMMGDVTYREEVAEHEEGIWAFAVAPMPKDRSAVRKLMELHYAKEGAELDLKFEMNNAVMSTLGTFDDMIEILSQVFLWVGLGFAVFSAFLLMNFIATSISYKKREIGILRAVGARSSDVFKIFFSESFIIAIINFICAVAASLATVIILNNYMRTQGINITLLSFGIRQVVLMLGVSVVVAVIASFLPVWNIAKRKPVDAIKDR